VSIEVADLIPDEWRHWLISDEVSAEWDGVECDEAEMLRIDAGRNLGFTRMVARRKS
jgi:hypothetical protein